MPLKFLIERELEDVAKEMQCLGEIHYKPL